jgi:hypothetical protein
MLETTASKTGETALSEPTRGQEQAFIRELPNLEEGGPSTAVSAHGAVMPATSDAAGQGEAIPAHVANEFVRQFDASMDNAGTRLQAHMQEITADLGGGLKQISKTLQKQNADLHAMNERLQIAIEKNDKHLEAIDRKRVEIAEKHVEIDEKHAEFAEKNRQLAGRVVQRRV